MWYLFFVMIAANSAVAMRTSSDTLLLEKGLDMNNYPLFGVPLEPLDDSSAASKAYVDMLSAQVEELCWKLVDEGFVTPDCEGRCVGKKKYDDCGVCGGDNATCSCLNQTGPLPVYNPNLCGVCDSDPEIACFTTCEEAGLTHNGVVPLYVPPNKQDPHPVLCHGDRFEGGWRRIAHENNGHEQSLLVLGTDNISPLELTLGGDGVLSSVFPRWEEGVDVLMEWWNADETGYMLFTTYSEAFSNVDETHMPIYDFMSSDARMMGWVNRAGGAVMCRSIGGQDTSWAITPLDDMNRGTGCNSGSWIGQGCYMSGPLYGGGFSGCKDHLEPKGGQSLYEFEISVRRHRFARTCNDLKPTSVFNAMVNDNHPVSCRNDAIMGQGWTKVAYEPAGSQLALRFLGTDTLTADALANEQSGGLYATPFTPNTLESVGQEILIVYGSDYIRFTPLEQVFSNSVGYTIPVIDFSCSDAVLASWVSTAQGAVFCRGYGGDTSWAIKPKDDSNYGSYGCNAVSWQGRGAFYAGSSYSGGFVGVKDNGEVKGSSSPYDVRIYTRPIEAKFCSTPCVMDGCTIPSSFFAIPTRCDGEWSQVGYEQQGHSGALVDLGQWRADPKALANRTVNGWTTNSFEASQATHVRVGWSNVHLEFVLEEFPLHPDPHLSVRLFAGKTTDVLLGSWLSSGAVWCNAGDDTNGDTQWGISTDSYRDRGCSGVSDNGRGAYYANQGGWIGASDNGNSKVGSSAYDVVVEMKPHHQLVCMENQLSIQLVSDATQNIAIPTQCYTHIATNTTGWMLLAHESLGSLLTLKNLGTTFGDPYDVASETTDGLLGTSYFAFPWAATSQVDVLITWGSDFIQFRVSMGELFNSNVNKNVPISAFATSDSRLNGWVTTSGGAILCRGYGADTSWAIKPSDQAGIATLGCNNAGWMGKGSFYSGTSYPGGWMGVKDDTEPKGGTSTFDMKLFVKPLN